MSERTTDRRYKSPWASLQDWVNTVGGVVAIVGAVAGSIAFFIGVLPFVRTDIYENDMAQVRLEVGGLKDMTKKNTDALESVNRTSLLNLELSLQSRVELLNGVMANMNRNSPAYLGLVNERDTARQQLDEVKRQLNR